MRFCARSTDQPQHTRTTGTRANHRRNHCFEDRFDRQGATFGSSPKAHRGLVQFEKRGEAVVYRAPERSYGGYALRDVTYVFKRNQLSTILFAVKSPNDCKPIRETLTRELGAPERVVGETSLWRGERVGLRFTVRGSGTCSAVVQSKELDRAEWDAL